MKRILLLGAAVALGIGAFSMVPKQKMTKAVEASDMTSVMQKYISSDGSYTKKSRIFVEKDAEGYDAKIFHAGHDVLERTTYYASGVLLMGNLDGTFGPINSGYANSGENMIHFRSEDGVSALSNEEVRTVDYLVPGKQMSDYFFVLDDLIANFDSTKWVYEEEQAQFKHEITTLAVDENGDYEDALLKQYQYFAAPMLLQDGAEHYLSPSNIIVKEEGGALNIRIYASGSDSGKLTREDNLLAESRVYAGIVKPGYYLVGEFGDGKDWQIDGGREMLKAGTNLAQLENVPLRDGKYQVCQLKDDGETAWFHDLDNQTYAFAELDGNDISIKYTGTYSFYLNEYGKVYLTRNDYKTVTFKFVLADSSLSSWDPSAYGFAVHLTTDQDGAVGTWGGDNEKLIEDNGVYTLDVHFHGLVNGVWFYFYQSGGEKKTENILGSLLIRNMDEYVITVGSLSWADGGVITSGVSLVAE